MSNITKRIGVLIDSARNNHAYKLERAILKFTERLSLRMKRRDISPSGLAEKINVKPPYISKILRGNSNFTLDSLIKIAAAVDCEFVFDLVPKEAPQHWTITCGDARTIKFTTPALEHVPINRMAPDSFNVYEKVIRISPMTTKMDYGTIQS